MGNTVYVPRDPKQAGGKSKLINPPRGLYSEAATDETRCPLCKRFPIREAYTDPNGKMVSVCARCTHHLDQHGFDEDFYWGLEHITESDGVNLRWDQLSAYRKE